MYDTDAAAAGDESANRWQIGAYGVLYNRAVTRAVSLQLHVNIQTPNRPKNLHTLNIRHTTKKKKFEHRYLFRIISIFMSNISEFTLLNVL